MKSEARNLWPLGIVAAFAIFIAGTAALIVVACANRNDLVTADYYEQEIRYQGRMESIERTRPWERAISIDYDASRGQITLALPAEHADGSASGSIQLYRPASAGQDRLIDLQLSGAGVQVIEAKDLTPGLWKVKVSWTAGGADYFVDRNMVVKARKS